MSRVNTENTEKPTLKPSSSKSESTHSVFGQIDRINNEITSFSNYFHQFETDLAGDLVLLKKKATGGKVKKGEKLLNNQYQCLCSKLKIEILDQISLYVTLERYFMVNFIK